MSTLDLTAPQEPETPPYWYRALVPCLAVMTCWVILHSLALVWSASETAAQGERALDRQAYWMARFEENTLQKLRRGSGEQD